MREARVIDLEAVWILALLVGIAVGIGVGWFTFPYLFPVFKNVELAAWVQALGTIFALFVAIYIMNAQHRHQLAVKRKEARSRVRMILKTAEIICVLSASLHRDRARALGVIRNKNDYRPLFLEWARLLRSLDVMGDGVIEIAPNVLQLCVCVDNFLEIENKFVAGKLEDDTAHMDLEFVFKHLERTIHLIEDYYNKEFGECFFVNLKDNLEEVKEYYSNRGMFGVFLKSEISLWR